MMIIPTWFAAGPKAFENRRDDRIEPAALDPQARTRGLGRSREVCEGSCHQRQPLLILGEGSGQVCGRWLPWLAPAAADRLAFLQRTDLIPATTAVSRCRLRLLNRRDNGCDLPIDVGWSHRVSPIYPGRRVF
jgi:hypothetical protein